jgi:hypothetical protein
MRSIDSGGPPRPLLAGALAPYISRRAFLVQSLRCCLQVVRQRYHLNVRAHEPAKNGSLQIGNLRSCAASYRVRRVRVRLALKIEWKYSRSFCEYMYQAFFLKNGGIGGSVRFLIRALSTSSSHTFLARRRIVRMRSSRVGSVEAFPLGVSNPFFMAAPHAMVRVNWPKCPFMNSQDTCTP